MSEDEPGVRVAEWLEEAITRSRRSQRDIADKIGIAHTTLHYIIRNKSVPKRDNFFAIVRELGYDPHIVLTELGLVGLYHEDVSLSDQMEMELALLREDVKGLPEATRLPATKALRAMVATFHSLPLREDDADLVELRRVSPTLAKKIERLATEIESIKRYGNQ